MSDSFETHLKAFSYTKTLTNYRALPISFVWLDGICQHELRENLGIKENEIPRLVLYDKVKEKIAISDIKFERNIVLEWVENFLRGKFNEFVDKDINVVDRDCYIFRNGLDAEESNEKTKKTKKKKRIHLNNDDDL